MNAGRVAPALRFTTYRARRRARWLRRHWFGLTVCAIGVAAALVRAL